MLCKTLVLDAFSPENSLFLSSSGVSYRDGLKWESHNESIEKSEQYIYIMCPTAPTGKVEDHNVQNSQIVLVQSRRLFFD